jgi:hypothetical protein
MASTASVLSWSPEAFQAGSPVTWPIAAWGVLGLWGKGEERVEGARRMGDGREGRRGIRRTY